MKQFFSPFLEKSQQIFDYTPRPILKSKNEMRIMQKINGFNFKITKVKFACYCRKGP